MQRKGKILNVGERLSTTFTKILKFISRSHKIHFFQQILFLKNCTTPTKKQILQQRKTKQKNDVEQNHYLHLPYCGILHLHDVCGGAHVDGKNILVTSKSMIGTCDSALPTYNTMCLQM